MWGSTDRRTGKNTRKPNLFSFSLSSRILNIVRITTILRNSLLSCSGSCLDSLDKRKTKKKSGSRYSSQESKRRLTFSCLREFTPNGGSTHIRRTSREPMTDSNTPYYIHSDGLMTGLAFGRDGISRTGLCANCLTCREAFGFFVYYCNRATAYGIECRSRAGRDVPITQVSRALTTPLSYFTFDGRFLTFGFTLYCFA